MHTHTHTLECTHTYMYIILRYRHQGNGGYCFVRFDVGREHSIHYCIWYVAEKGYVFPMGVLQLGYGLNIAMDTSIFVRMHGTGKGYYIYTHILRYSTVSMSLQKVHLQVRTGIFPESHGEETDTRVHAWLAVHFPAIYQDYVRTCMHACMHAST